MNKINGFLCGLLSSASFGLIPLFTLPAMHQGMNFELILLYRFFFAALALAGLLLLTGKSFHIKLKEIPSLFLLALLYLMSALFLFWGYKLMSSGVATTLHFMYPVFTTLIMMLFFHEKRSMWRFGAILLAISGVFFLSSEGGGSGHVTLIGIIIVLISALGYALYLVTVSQLKVGQMNGLKLTFYVFVLGGSMLALGILPTTGIQAIPSWDVAGNLLMLALIPTVISNLALVHAVKSIGSTITSVLGAMEPVTAICVGIFIFNEAVTAGIGLGIGLIIAAVTIIILKR